MAAYGELSMATVSRALRPRHAPLQSGPNIADTYVGLRGRLRTRSWETRSSPTTARARIAGPPTARRWHEPQCGKRAPRAGQCSFSIRRGSLKC